LKSPYQDFKEEKPIDKAQLLKERVETLTQILMGEDYEDDYQADIGLNDDT
jgi:hypothetical protein